MCEFLNVLIIVALALLVIINMRVTRKKDDVPPFTERIETLDAEYSLQLFTDQMIFIYGLDAA